MILEGLTEPTAEVMGKGANLPEAALLEVVMPGLQEV